MQAREEAFSLRFGIYGSPSLSSCCTPICPGRWNPGKDTETSRTLHSGECAALVCGDSPEVWSGPALTGLLAVNSEVSFLTTVLSRRRADLSTRWLVALVCGWQREPQVHGQLSVAGVFGRTWSLSGQLCTLKPYASSRVFLDHMEGHQGTILFTIIAGQTLMSLVF